MVLLEKEAVGVYVCVLVAGRREGDDKDAATGEWDTTQVN